MDTNVFIDDSEGRMYIPIRFFAQAMGYTVGWDEATETVRLDRQVSAPAETPEDAPAE